MPYGTTPYGTQRYGGNAPTPGYVTGLAIVATSRVQPSPAATGAVSGHRRHGRAHYGNCRELRRLAGIGGSSSDRSRHHVLVFGGPRLGRYWLGGTLHHRFLVGLQLGGRNGQPCARRHRRRSGGPQCQRDGPGRTVMLRGGRLGDQSRRGGPGIPCAAGGRSRRRLPHRGRHLGAYWAATAPAPFRCAEQVGQDRGAGPAGPVRRSVSAPHIRRFPTVTLEV
jgi:hypothetical protein